MAAPANTEDYIMFIFWIKFIAISFGTGAGLLALLLRPNPYCLTLTLLGVIFVLIGLLL
jgi:hypothetical protein